VAIIVAALALWVFVIHTFTAEEPFFNPRLLLDRNYALGLLVAAVMGMLMFTPMVLFPGLLHDLRGYPDDLIGALLAGRGIGNWLSSYMRQLCRLRGLRMCAFPWR